jgi:hypothetical protein
MGAFDIKSMIVFEDPGSGLGGLPAVYLITSPNWNSCPVVRSGPQSVRAREDGRYYTEDFTSYPQVFTEEFGYNSVVLRRPSDPHHPLQPLWWIPKEEDHLIDRGSMFTGLGTLAPHRLDCFKKLQRELTARAKNYHEEHRLQQSLMHSLERSLRYCLERLSSLPCTFKDLVGQVAEFQRVYLDLLSWLDFQQHFAPRWVDESRDTEVDSTRMGAYTTQPDTLQWLYGAGIPVWFVRHIESCDKAEHLDVPHDIMYPDSSSKDWRNGDEPDPFPTIYTGPAGARCQTVVKRMGSFLANAADLSGDSFISQASETGPTRSSKSHNRSSMCKSIRNTLCMKLSTYFFSRQVEAAEAAEAGRE